MTDTPEDSPAPRRWHLRVPLALAIVAAAVVGVAAYTIGHSQGASGDDRPASSSRCAKAQAALTRQNATTDASPSDTDALRTTANLVLENQDCFDPQVVAAVQTYVDKLNAGSG
ncbi:hypothetical protein [Streptomyces sp. NRRL F-5123]|uniref:hypothetical protein n=1 Tax=Streptomyces sp. NRRL F-5123 TaxID=1463856 RepID=UPI0004E1A9DD|nr:hypothetical protein [Streptomyces sp. NRRL F-5123]